MPNYKLFAGVFFTIIGLAGSGLFILIGSTISQSDIPLASELSKIFYIIACLDFSIATIVSIISFFWGHFRGESY